MYTYLFISKMPVFIFFSRLILSHDLDTKKSFTEKPLPQSITSSNYCNFVDYIQKLPMYNVIGYIHVIHKVAPSNITFRNCCLFIIHSANFKFQIGN